MILVDDRDGPDKEHRIRKEMMSHLLTLGVTSKLHRLYAADFCFDGYGPDGVMSIGIERKTLNDMMGCIDDARFNSQRVKMGNIFGQSMLIVEGVWSVHTQTGYIMQQAVDTNGRPFWKPFSHRTKPVQYATLHNYLISVGLTGVVTTLTRDLYHTCCSVVQSFHYFQKRWEDHTSMRTKQTLNLPAITHKPHLVRRWAAEIDSIGVVLSEEAERIFKTPLALATSDEIQWMRINGISVTKAQRIVRQIGGLSDRWM